ncbi:Asp23/Gls24 family envelope stress response protein [Corynebacterium lizhenjunii]|uniref:Asp23/Gls24 family envelope stress response protein n=1 Tax=Corynebacterium lizhenjunii TaxID=2709394 RepID=A0A7T0PBK8_9CORY|nr:Asp23/Gls24 family envelope stress response protein [Corynebacterium lizhenjunii]QPK79545.1 Asp23/Gls24 family envelope stress response protein [Corynebacterium lizhenjunii]
MTTPTIPSGAPADAKSPGIAHTGAPAEARPSGTTRIGLRAMERVVHDAIDHVPGTVRVQGTLKKLGGKDFPRLAIQMDPDTQMVAIDTAIAVAWPSPVTEVAAAVRSAIGQAVQDFCGYTPTRINVVVGHAEPSQQRVTSAQIAYAQPLTPRQPVARPLQVHAPSLLSTPDNESVREPVVAQSTAVRTPQVPQPTQTRPSETPRAVDVREPETPQALNVWEPEAPRPLSVREPKAPQALNVREPEAPQSVPLRVPQAPKPLKVSTPKAPRPVEAIWVDVPRPAPLRQIEVRPYSRQPRSEAR